MKQKVIQKASAYVDQARSTSIPVIIMLQEKSEELVTDLSIYTHEFEFTLRFQH